MEIKSLSNVMSAYKNIKGFQKDTGKTRKEGLQKNRDTVEFSAQADAALKFQTSKIVNEDANAEKIAGIKDAIANNEYNISAELILKAMIG